MFILHSGEGRGLLVLMAPAGVSGCCVSLGQLSIARDVYRSIARGRGEHGRMGHEFPNLFFSICAFDARNHLVPAS